MASLFWQAVKPLIQQGHECMSLSGFSRRHPDGEHKICFRWLVAYCPLPVLWTALSAAEMSARIVSLHMIVFWHWHCMGNQWCLKSALQHLCFMPQELTSRPGCFLHMHSSVHPPFSPIELALAYLIRPESVW